MLLIKMDNCVQAGETQCKTENIKDFFVFQKFSTHNFRKII